MATLSDILTWWNRNQVPTVDQRTQTFNSFLLKTDNKVVLSPGVNSYDVPAQTVITCILILGGSTDQYIGVGTTRESDDLFSSGECPANGHLPFEGNKYFKDATSIYFNGVASDTIVVIYKQ